MAPSYKFSDNHLSMLSWNSTHFYRTSKHKKNFYEVMSKESQKNFDECIKQISVVTIRNIVTSGLCLEEYCSKYGGVLKDFKEMSLIIRDDYPELFEAYSNIKKEPSEEFYTYIKWVVMVMKAKEESFDIFDYYFYTKLHPLTFRSICKRILKDSDLKRIVTILNKFRMYDFLEVDKEMILNAKIIINNYEINHEEKEKNFNCLDENNIPYITYKAAFKKYVNRESKLMDLLNPRKKIK